MKLCKDCKYCKGFFTLQCRHPDNMKTNLVTGKLEPNVPIVRLRTEDKINYCGPKGSWHTK